VVNVGGPRDELKKHIKRLLCNLNRYRRLLPGEGPKDVSSIARNNSTHLTILKNEKTGEKKTFL